MNNLSFLKNENAKTYIFCLVSSIIIIFVILLYFFSFEFFNNLANIVFFVIPVVLYFYFFMVVSFLYPNNYLSFRGKLGRKQYGFSLLFLLILLFVIFKVYQFGTITYNDTISVFSLTLFTCSIITYISVLARRIQDMGFSFVKSIIFSFVIVLCAINFKYMDVLLLFITIFLLVKKHLILYRENES